MRPMNRSERRRRGRIKARRRWSRYLDYFGEFALDKAYHVGTFDKWNPVPSCGNEYWSLRLRGCWQIGTYAKSLTHRLERRQGQREIRDQLRDAA